MMKVGFIGAGNMGAALAGAVCKRGGVTLLVSDKDERKAEELATALGAKKSDNITIARECDYIFLGVKPNIIKAVAEEIREELKGREGCTVISMAAGVSISSLEECLGNIAIIRIMPNTPVSVGHGVIIWSASSGVSDAKKEEFATLLSYSGLLDEIPEGLIDAASALSGCGPAFVYTFIEALADGAAKCGLPREKAILYACDTLIGAAELLKSSKRSPGELRDAVCSPGGSTIEGVRALSEGSFGEVTEGAVIAAYNKTLTLGK